MGAVRGARHVFSDFLVFIFLIHVSFCSDILFCNFLSKYYMDEDMAPLMFSFRPLAFVFFVRH